MKYLIWQKVKAILQIVKDMFDELGSMHNDTKMWQDEVRAALKTINDRIGTMAETLEEAVARNSQKVVDAVTAAVAKEVGDVKALIQQGNTAAAIAALDKLGDAAAAAATAQIDTIDTSATTPPPAPNP